MRAAVTSLVLPAALALLSLASATINPVPHVHVDEQFLDRQLDLLKALWHLDQPLLDPHLKSIADSYNLEDHLSDFKNPQVVETFIKYYTSGYFNSGEQYRPDQAKKVVDLLYNANDFDTFFNATLWTREHLNVGLFLYSFYVAKLHRDDTFDIVLPPFYEIYPKLFVTTDVIKQARDAALEGKTFDPKHPYVINVNNSGYPDAHNPDEELSYFTEDVGLSAYLDFMQYRYPFWAKMTDYNQDNYTRRGDHFYYGIKAILSRFNLERLSNKLPDVEAVDYKTPVPGAKTQLKIIEEISTLERRLCDAVDSGYVFDNDLKKYSLRNSSRIETFGRIVEGNADSINKDFYGSFYNSLQQYVVHDNNFCHHKTAAPFILDRPAAPFRYPLFYKIVKRIGEKLDKFKNYLGHYSQEELTMPGVKVESLTVGKLVTFFEDYDFDLENAVLVKDMDEAKKLNVVARTKRLTHQTFSYHVHVTSDKEIEAFVRFFIGPRYDVYGRELTLNEKRHHMVFIDSFCVQLKVGENELVRNSTDFTYYGQVPLTYKELYQATKDAIENKTHPYIDDFVHKYGYCDHLALPRGTRSGLPLSTYVIIKPYTHITMSRRNPCTDDIGAKVSFFPFDRPIDELDFNVPNSYFGETVVHYKNADEVVAD